MLKDCQLEIIFVIANNEHGANLLILFTSEHAFNIDLQDGSRFCDKKSCIMSTDFVNNPESRAIYNFSEKGTCVP